MRFDKPGCFGNGITYSTASKVCSECDDRAECSVEARQRLEEVRSLVDVDTLIKIAHKQPQTVTAPSISHELRTILQVMTIRQRKAVGMLMKMNNPSAAEFVQSLMRNSGYEKDESIQLAKEVLKILVSKNVAEIQSGKIVLRN